MITKVYGVCPHDCPDSCGFITEVEDGRALQLYADPDHPIAQGWLCAKVRPYLNHVYHPKRLQTPLRHVGPKGGGQWQRISWDEAIGEIGERWRDIIAEYGAEAILPYSYSGTLGLVQMGVSSGRFWNRLGASQLQRSICGAAAETAVEATLGKRFNPRYEDVLHSKVAIIWGHNPVTTAPHFMPHLTAARKNGTKLIVIDPRRTRTAKQADWHIKPRPGSDGALALGLAHIIEREEWQDEAWLATHTVGWPELRARLAEYPPQRVAEITGLEVGEIERLGRLYAIETPSLIKIADGLQRNRGGGQTVRAVCALPALTGQYGRRGGGLMYSASGFVQWDGEAVNKWSKCPAPGRVINMNRLGAALTGEAQNPPIQSLYVFGANPAASSPNTNKIVAGLKREDLFTVVHELFMTDTAVYADILLPATSQLEQTDLHKGYGTRVLAYNAPAIPPLGECKSNWQLMRLLAAEMDFAEPWLQQSEDEVIAEVLAATAVHNPALKNITLERLQNEHSIELAFEPDVPFADGRFPTPSGKVELVSERLNVDHDDGGRPSANGGLWLITGAAHHFVSSTFAGQPDLRAREGDPFIEIHPEDAAVRGIENGDWVMVENGRGVCELKAVVTDGIRPGIVASPKGRWGVLEGGHVNFTTSDTLGDLAGQSTFHSNRVWIRVKT
ncbi:MAG: molybdopterin oxidoreductase family protein [Chloroflexi bacterium]|nr:molybdopterin oxidoreductase family protein [Chloroflexota bacterium]